MKPAAAGLQFSSVDSLFAPVDVLIANPAPILTFNL